MKFEPSLPHKDLIYFKNQVAKEYGYQDWNECYDWIAREGERPDVVAQQIESLCDEANKRMRLHIIELISYMSSRYILHH